MEGGAAGARRRLLVLGAGAAQIGLLRAARERGLWVIAADRDPAAPGFVYADRRALISTEDEDGIARLAAAERVEGIVAPGIDWPVLVAARVAARLGLPHPISPDTAARATSKLRQRERLDEAGVPQPRWRLTKQADGLGFPCVVKPPDRQGQRGVSLVRAEADLGPAIERAVRDARGGTALVEELVEGREVTVNGFSVGGRFHPLTVTDRLVAEPPAFGVALAHVWPARDGDDAAARAADAAVRALGIGDGPSYTQIRLARDGARVIEVAARLGGGHDAELCELAIGVDLNGLTIASALGEAVELPRPRPRAGGACVRFLVAPEGELRAVEGVEEARRLPGIADVRIYRRPGFVFGPLRRGADRAGAVLSSGRARDEALARSRRAAACIRFEVV